MMAAPPKNPAHPEAGGVDPAELQAYFVRAGRYTAGVATRYRPGALTGDSTHQSLAQGFTIGTRFHSSPVVRIADAKPMHLGHVARADGRWRLYVFADASGKALEALCDQLVSSPESVVRLATPAGADVDSVFDLRAVLQTPHREVRLEDLHASLLPRKGRYGLVDYEKAFTSDASTDIFNERGIDRERGALIVVRPDQYVAHVLPLDAFDELNAFLKPIFLTDPISQSR